MEGKKYSLLFALLFIPISVFGLCEGTSFSDNFDYSSTFATNGYSYTAGCGFSCEKSNPVTSPFSTNAFGYNSTMGACVPCGSNTLRAIKKSIGINFTTGVVYFSADLSVKNSTSPLQTNFIIGLGNTTGSVNNFQIYINRFGAVNTSYVYVVVEDTTGQDCLAGTPNYNNYDVSLLLTLDLSSRTYTININGTNYCENYYLGDNNLFKVGAFDIEQGITGGTNLSIYSDNIQICSDYIANISGELGTPCTTGGDCATGKCEYGMCVQKTGNEPCKQNSDCISGRCIGGKCVKPSLSKLLTASVSEMFGTDSESLTLVSLFLMIGIPTAVVISASALGSSVLALFGVVLFIILGFTFTLIGWLNPFITLGIVVCGLVITIFVFMLKANS